jgi:ABC-type siderophore export system fused ATPase/permease subunit
MGRKTPASSTKLDEVIIETRKGKEFTVGEIKHSNRIQKSATPKQDLSSMSIRGVPGLQFYDLVLSLIGVCGWMIVGFLWKDRALMLLNGVGIVLFLNTLIKSLVG